LAVFGEIPNSSAISFTVKNSFPFISISQIIGIFAKNYNKYTHELELLDICIVNIQKKYFTWRVYLLLTLLYLVGII
jgi:hypothetical protein